MTLALPEFAPARRTSGVLDTIDGLALAVAVLWMAEATVRLPGGHVVTAAVYAWFGLRMALYLPRMDLSFALIAGMLAFPLVCLASVLWSPVPGESLTATIQLIFTLALALYAGSRHGLTALAWIVAAALSAALALSAVNLMQIWPPVYSWEGGFLGVFTNKNALGQRAALLLLTATCLALTHRGALRIVALGMALLATWMLGLSLSVTGQILGTGSAFAALALATARNGRFFGWMLGTLTLGGLAAVLTWAATLRVDLLSAALTGFGKSHSLTGRTQLWEIAQAKIAAAPLLGTGYMGFWTAPANRHETELIAVLYGATVGSFHNFALEIGVMTGALGLAAFALLLSTVAIRLRAAHRHPMRDWAWLSAGLILALSALGSSLYRPHEISLFLLVALGVAATHRSGAAYSSQNRPRAASR